MYTYEVLCTRILHKAAYGSSAVLKIIAEAVVVKTHSKTHETQQNLINSILYLKYCRRWVYLGDGGRIFFQFTFHYIFKARVKLNGLN